MIKIAGAGISGLTAAINLARWGFEVEVYERQPKYNRYHISAIRNYELEQDAMDELNIYGINLRPGSSSHRVIRYSPNFRVEEVSDKPVYYLFERGDAEDSIENQLLKQALNLGIKVHFGKDVQENEVNIVATGPRRKDIYAYGHIYEDLNLPGDTSVLIYDNEYAPQGYIYILTVNRRTIIASVSFNKNSFKKLPSLFDLFLRNHAFASKLVGKARPVLVVSGWGNFGCLKTAFKNGRYLVGERGLFLDASKGFGIRYAIITGYLAAEAIYKNVDYDRLWQEKIKKELLLNMKRRNKLNQFQNRDYDLMLERAGERTTLNSYLKTSRYMLDKH